MIGRGMRQQQRDRSTAVRRVYRKASHHHDAAILLVVSWGGGCTSKRRLSRMIPQSRSFINNYHAPLPLLLWYTNTLYSFPPLVVTLQRIVAGWSWRAPLFFFPFTTAASSTLQPPASKSIATMALNRYNRKGWGKSERDWRIEQRACCCAVFFKAKRKDMLYLALPTGLGRRRTTKRHPAVAFFWVSA